jgi:hypothetical protein
VQADPVHMSSLGGPNEHVFEMDDAQSDTEDLDMGNMSDHDDIYHD